MVALWFGRNDLAMMDDLARAPLKAILGPTNTGKTHLAVERMMGHSSGMIGFPLRLLAREVYDRVVKAKGVNQVALLTGEEKILPKHDRGYYHEYTVKTPGEKDRGARRIVTGNAGERYYTDDHYKSFRRIAEDGGTS